MWPPNSALYSPTPPRWCNYLSTPLTGTSQSAPLFLSSSNKSLYRPIDEGCNPALNTTTLYDSLKYSIKEWATPLLSSFFPRLISIDYKFVCVYVSRQFHIPFWRACVAEMMLFMLLVSCYGAVVGIVLWCCCWYRVMVLLLVSCYGAVIAHRRGWDDVIYVVGIVLWCCCCYRVMVLLLVPCNGAVVGTV